MTKPIRVMIVDDHSIVRAGIRSILDLQEDLQISGEAASLSEMMIRIREDRPDVVLLDFKLPDGDGVQGIRSVKKIDASIRVVVLTAFTEDEIIQEAMRAGADGFLLKQIDGATIAQVIRTVASGIPVLDPISMNRMINSPHSPEEGVAELTHQERVILGAIAEGLTNREIGAKLYLSEKTIRNQLSRIFRKIEVTNRTEAALYWAKQSRDSGI